MNKFQMNQSVLYQMMYFKMKFAYKKGKSLTCSTTMFEALREEYISCNIDDAPSNAEVEQ